MDFNRYDVTMKQLIPDGPPAWVERFGIGPPGAVQEIDAGITTLTASADKVYRVEEPKPYLVDFEFQSSPTSDLVRTLWYRQVALDYKHCLPVLTVLLLLRKEANSPALNGVYERQLPDGRQTNRYYYRVVRLWEEDPEPYLTGHVSLAPLAPLTAVIESDLPRVVQRVKDRIDQEPEPRAAMLRTATAMLMGLRFSDELILQVLGGLKSMKDSTIYQRILREGLQEGRQEGRQEGHQEGHQEGLQEGLNLGEIREARRFLLILGTQRFGEPDSETLTALGAIRSVERLEALGRRMIVDPNIGGWEDLLR